MEEVTKHNKISILVFANLFVVLSLVSCAPRKTNIENDIFCKAINYLIDSTIMPTARGNEIITFSPIYYRELDSVFFNAIKATNKYFKDCEIATMMEQGRKASELSLENCIDHEADVKFTSQKPLEKGEFHYELSPPIFNNDSNAFLIFVKGSFIVSDSIRWDALVYVYRIGEKKNITLDHLVGVK